MNNLRGFECNATQEIRNEKITHDEGVNLEKKYDNKFPKNILKNF